VAEVLLAFSERIPSRAGETYIARACGRQVENGMWEGWIEFLPSSGGPPIRSGRETTQPNRQDALYWATGVTPVYLEGALERAVNPSVPAPPAGEVAPAYDGPAQGPSSKPPAAESILNPFAVFRKGEDLLRRQLAALSGWHLVNIIVAYELSEQIPRALSATPDDVLLELIVSQVRARSDPASG
jgi:hypothetical protein